MSDIWTVVCTDRGQHSEVTIGTSRLLARRSPDNTITHLVPVPLDRAENLGARDREGRRAERQGRQERGFGGWPASPEDDRIPVSNHYRCVTCRREPRVRHATLVKAANLLQIAEPTRRALDVSYLG